MCASALPDPVSEPSSCAGAALGSSVCGVGLAWQCRLITGNLAKAHRVLLAWKKVVPSHWTCPFHLGPSL